MEKKRCPFCGEHELIEGDMCPDCTAFKNFKFSRPQHPVWLLQFLLDKLEEMIDRNQTKRLEYEDKAKAGFPMCKHTLSNDSWYKRIESIDEFLSQYYELHRVVLQLYKIVRNRQMEIDAEEIVNFLKNRK